MKPETEFPFTVIVTLVMKIFPWQYDRYPSMESAGCKRIFAPVVRKAGNRHPPERRPRAAAGASEFP